MTTCRCGATWSGHRVQHCVAPGCHATFTGSTAGDMHRVGDHAASVGPTRRRCLTVDEMALDKGMTANLNAHGTIIWGTGKGQDDRSWPTQRESAGLTGHARVDVVKLTEFLLARIAEDPAKARDAAWSWLTALWPAATIDDDPEWAAEMVEMWLEPARPDTPPAFRHFGLAIDERDMKMFAAFYADHPDCDEGWRL